MAKATFPKTQKVVGADPERYNYENSGMKDKIQVPGGPQGGMPNQNPVRNSLMGEISGDKAPARGTLDDVLYQRDGHEEKRQS